MSAFDAFIKNFLEEELVKRAPLQEFAFHKDVTPLRLENVSKLQNYLIENYKNNQDFKIWINYGEDVMHSLHIYNTKLMEDDELHELLSNCDLIVDSSNF